LRDLYKVYGNTLVTKLQLEEFLTRYNVEDLCELNVRLVGWIIDEEPHCFRWNSLYPQGLYYNPYYYDGSGGEVFDKLVDNEMMSNPGEPGIRHAINHALYLTSNLMSDEILGANNRRAGFGHAYEVVYFDGERFKYLDDILYVLWAAQFNSQSELTEHQLFPPLYRYRNFSNYSIVQAYDPIKNETDIYVMTPIWHERAKVDNVEAISEVINDYKAGKRMFIKSDYTCLFLLFAYPNNTYETTSTIINPTAVNPPLVIAANGDTEQIGLNLDFLVGWSKYLKSVRSKE
jgi:hypothetical protein